jgi:hypothetical protein
MMRTSRRAAWVVAGGIALGGTTSFLEGTAAAYVRTRASESNMELAWKCPNLKLHFLPSSAPDSVSAEYFRKAAGEAAAQWSASNLACTKMSIEVVASSQSTVFVEGDRVNYVQFRRGEGEWGRNARLAKDKVPYPANALAITSVFAERKTGVIVDTDVEINGLFAMWGDVVANPMLLKSTNTHDLQNTLTHEFGHVIGLDHTCDGGGQSNLVDNEMKRVPACPGSSAIQETTMAAIVMPGDTLRRTLAPDDQKGVCEIYPADGVPTMCTNESGGDGGGGCNLGSRPSHSAWGVVAALAGLAFTWRRKRR